MRYIRPYAQILQRRLAEPRRFIQAVTGPRQVGKSTLVQQVVSRSGLAAHIASADLPTLRSPIWIEQQWEIARREASQAGKRGALLVLDEIHKVPSWSEAVKRLWDEDTRAGNRLKVILLGSAPLLIQQGLTESLAGRFEVVRLPHWSFAEMRDAFGWGVEHFVFYGGYPGAAPLVHDPPRWAAYILDSLIETTLSRDVLLLTRVDKPAVLRRIFRLGCAYSGQILSYTKMMGQLQDAGNTVTLAHYLDLLSAAGMVTGLTKYAGEVVRQRGSSPKLQVFNTALISAQAGLTMREARRDHEIWGRLVESAVGAHLANAAALNQIQLFYWRERNEEVDFVVKVGRKLTALEVKTSRARLSPPGLKAFGRAFRGATPLLVGGDGIPLDQFLARPVEHWFSTQGRDDHGRLDT